MIKKDEYRIEFVVRMCGDVLVEILQYGDRRRLTKLERVGRRLNWMVEKWYPEIPFLRLNLKLEPWYISYVSYFFLLIGFHKKN